MSMPEWWPLLATEKGMTYQALGMIPLAASLGYSDLFGKQKEVERRRIYNSILIIGYAAVLLGLCVMTSKTGKGEWAAIIWMSAGHEAIIASSNLFTKN